ATKYSRYTDPGNTPVGSSADFNFLTMLMLKADKIDHQHDCDNREKDKIQPERTNGFHVNSPHRTTGHKKTLTSCQMKNIYHNMIKVLPTSYCSTFLYKV